MSDSSKNGHVVNGKLERFEDPTLEVVRRLESGGFSPRPIGPRIWESLCPVHSRPGEHTNRCLEVTDGDTSDSCVMHCQAHGCDWKGIVANLGLHPSQLFRPSPDVRPRNKPVKKGYEKANDAVKFLRKPGWKLTYYVYSPTFSILRFDTPEGKKVWPVSQNGDGLWRIQDPEGPLPLYGSCKLHDLPDGTTVWVVEGEKCVDILKDLGIPAVTNSHGSKAAKKTDWGPLSRFRVVLNPDNDPDGEKHMETVAGILGAFSTPPDVRLVRFPNLPPAGDVEQYVASCMTPEIAWENMQVLAEEAPVVERPKVEDPKDPGESYTHTGRSGRNYKHKLVKRASETKELITEWLWKDRIPLGFLTLFAGRTGSGKSMIAIDVAARLSLGGEIPLSDGKRFPKGGTLILSEDPFERMIMPRFRLAGGDPSLFCGMDEDALAEFSLCDQEMLEDAYYDAGEPRLIIIDPPANFLNGRDENSNEQVRGILKRVATWADKKNVAVIMITHCNKGAGKDIATLDRIIGSVAWATSMRVVNFVGNHPEDTRTKVFSLGKTNIGNMDRSISLKLNPAEDTAVVEWSGYIDMDAGDLIGPPRKKPGPAAVKTEEVATWLYDLLVNHGQPMTWKDVFNAGGQAGYAGTQNEDGRWSNVKALYRAQEMIPQLASPRAGMEVVTVDVADLMGRPRKGWSIQPSRNQEDVANEMDIPPY